MPEPQSIQHARWIREVKQPCVFSTSLNKRHEHLPSRMTRKQTSRCKQVQAQLSTDLKNYSSCLIVTNCRSVNCGAGQAGHWLLLLSYSTTIHAIHVTHTETSSPHRELETASLGADRESLLSNGISGVELSSHLSAVQSCFCLRLKI